MAATKPVSVKVSSDAQIAWLAIVRAIGGGVTLNTVAAAIAYHEGRRGGAPPESEDGWEKRARAALSELLLQDLVTVVPPGVSRKDRPTAHEDLYLLGPSARLPDLTPDIREADLDRLESLLPAEYRNRPKDYRPTAAQQRAQAALRNPRRYR